MKISELRVKKLWEFPPLPDGKQGRVITKHFTNLSYTLDPNQYALLNFLIYNSGADNTVIYSVGLLERYKLTVLAAKKLYGGETKLWLSEPTVKKILAYLVENGLLLHIGGNKFLISPCLTFSKLYVKQDFYKEWMWIYNENYPIKHLVSRFTEHVNKNFTNRKSKS